MEISACGHCGFWPMTMPHTTMEGHTQRRPEPLIPKLKPRTKMESMLRPLRTWPPTRN